MKKNFLWFILLFSLCFSFFAESSETKKRILVGTPIRQKPAILKEFLESLEAADKETYTFNYMFFDDNVIEESHQLLKDFNEKHAPFCTVLNASEEEKSIEYICNETQHVWHNDLIWKVAHFKDVIIEKAIEQDYDYLFLVDSDLVLHPQTVEQLLKAKKEIVCNIFWTKWWPDSIPQPQVWLVDQYVQEEPGRTAAEFYEQLRQPGTYEVGGMGACTLISRAALKKGVNFKPIKNISLLGEDRHFCVRALALGLSVFVDTHYPSYHIYRESALDGVEEYKQATRQPKKSEPNSPRVTLSMIMKNEANSYLREMLSEAKEYITDAVIIDDASTDNSIEVVEEVLKGIPLHIVRNGESKFSNEVTLRKQQWEETVKTNPEWIIFLDADQIFESKFKDEIKELVKDTSVDVYYFRLYDFWDREHYREDMYWSGHHIYRPILVRYKPDMECKWKESAQHCGSFPYTVLNLPGKCSELRLKHYGWAKPEDRVAKYERYMRLDPGARYGWREQYESILDPNPVTIKWEG